MCHGILCIWQPGDVYNFILNYLGPTLKANGQSGVEPMMPETGCVNLLASYCRSNVAGFRQPRLMLELLAFMTTAADQGHRLPTRMLKKKLVWLTETSETTAWDPSISDGLKWAASRSIIFFVNMNVSAWHYWNLIGNNGAGYENEGLIFPDGTTSKRLYAVLGKL